jgi:hypothetical protein
MKELNVNDIHNVINVVEVPGNILNVRQDESILTISTIGVSGKSGTSGTSGTSGFLLLSGSTINGIITLNADGTGTVNDNLSFDGDIFNLIGNISIRSNDTADGIKIGGGETGIEGYDVLILPEVLSGNRTLTLADGDTILRPGTMVSEDRKIEIFGTLNQISVLPSTSIDLSDDISITLSLPQDIGIESFPTFSGMFLTDVLKFDNITIGDSKIEFTTDTNIVGIITTDVNGLYINNTFFGDDYISGSFVGIGDMINFNRIGTNQNYDTELIVGNYYNDDIVSEYDYKQTTVFKNANLIVSGSIELSNGGYLKLNPMETPPDINGDVGGLYYSTDGYYYLTSLL